MNTNEDADQLVERLSAEQNRINTDREAMADEIVAGQRCASLEEALRFARAWIITAAQHASNENYLRKERDKLLHVIQRAGRENAAALETLQSVASDMGLLKPVNGRYKEIAKSWDEQFHSIACAPRAAVSYVDRADGRLLAVWNRRYNGWSMPGGKVEDGETIFAAQARELEEETGLATIGASVIYSAPTSTNDSHITSDRGRHVYVFSVVTSGEPRETEAGCPVRWMTREEFLAESPFREFYREMFAKVPQ